MNSIELSNGISSAWLKYKELIDQHDSINARFIEVLKQELRAAQEKVAALEAENHRLIKQSEALARAVMDDQMGNA